MEASPVGSVARAKSMRRLLATPLPAELKWTILSTDDVRYTKAFVKHRYIFVHIPKVAGRSMAAALGIRDPGHHSISEYRDASRRLYDQYYKFGFVRNPWDRAVSMYFYFRRMLDDGIDGWWRDVADCGSFSDFVLEYLVSANIEESYFLRPQADFLFDYDNQLLVDFVGRFENLNQDIQAVLEKLGLPAVALRKINPSEHDHYTSYYTQREVDVISQLYKRDVDLFSYAYDAE